MSDSIISDVFNRVPSPPAIERVLPRTPALQLYERELAFFEADREFLTAEKAAERCLKLSLLLTQAKMESA